MIREKELNRNAVRLNAERRANFLYHYFAMNELRAEYGRPMHVTSGVRSWLEHIDIYRRKNLRREKAGLSAIPTPLKSSHLEAAATDFLDTTGELYRFCEVNEELLIELGIYVENRRFTPTWCHLQTVPTRSGSRFFLPW